MKDEFTLTLNSPITEEQWDTITDVDFEHTNEITFHTKHGKEVVFVKKSAQPEYEPVKLEDFAKTMSENTFYSFMAWYGEALGLMERHGFVICKKTM